MIKDIVKRISLPVQLVAVIAFVLLLGSYVPEPIVRGAYTFSLIFKDLLGVLLPLIVFSFVLGGILALKKNAPLILSVLLGTIFCSNALVAMLSYFVCKLALPFVLAGTSTEAFTCGSEIIPYFTLNIPTFIGAEKALVAAIILGIILSWYRVSKVERAILRFKESIQILLTSFLIPVIPLYVLGFLLKIQCEGVFSALFFEYGRTFALIVTLQLSYLAFMYFVVSGFRWQRALTYIKVALPSYLTAFSTMSSTATVPVSIAAAEENTGNRALSEVSMPIMANVHLLGDSISTPILALVTMGLFLGYTAGIWHYLNFVLYFCLAMFAVSGIPGGGIIVMIPVLTSQFGFTTEMISIIMTLYVLFDSFGTAANVMGDGALVIFVNKVLQRLGLVEQAETAA